MGKGFSYSRTKNPTCEVLGKKIAEMEKGAGCAVFSTGALAPPTPPSTNNPPAPTHAMLASSIVYAGADISSASMLLQHFELTATTAHTCVHLCAHVRGS